MSGYGTAKFPQNAINLGMPRAFSEAYAEYGAPEQFAPTAMGSGLNNIVGGDFQAQWHQQKKRDADYMANAKVQSTHMMNVRGFTSPHGYYNLPPPVLGQRRFANGSMGAIYSHSTREDQPGAPFTLVASGAGDYESFPAGGARRIMSPFSAEGMASLTGGVLRTSAGQRHGVAQLNNRIAQLNAINEAKMDFLSSGSMRKAGFAGDLSYDSGLAPGSLVELANLLQAIKDSLTAHGGRLVSHRDVLLDSSRAFNLIVKMAVNNEASDLANVLEFIQGTSAGDGIGQLLQYQAENIDERFDGEDEILVEANSRITQQIEFWGNLARYLKKMIEVSELPTNVRQQTSDALLKTLKFNRLIRNSEMSYRTGVVRDEDFMDATGYVNNPENAQRAQDLMARAGRSGAFINPGRRPLGEPTAREGRFSQFAPFDRPPPDGGEDYQSFPSDNRTNPSASTFSRRGARREDSQRGYLGWGGAEFSRSAQDAFAFGSGEFLDRSGGRPRAFMGEEVLASYGEGAPTQGEVERQREEEGAGEEGAEEEGVEEEDELHRYHKSLREGGVPQLASRRDPTTGEYDVAPVAPPREPVRPGVVVLPPPPARAQKPYKESDVPRTIPELREFIRMLEQRHGYKQAIYKKAGADPKPRSVRVNTIAKMKSAGLL